MLSAGVAELPSVSLLIPILACNEVAEDGISEVMFATSTGSPVSVVCADTRNLDEPSSSVNFTYAVLVAIPVSTRVSVAIAVLHTACQLGVVEAIIVHPIVEALIELSQPITICVVEDSVVTAPTTTSILGVVEARVLAFTVPINSCAESAVTPAET
jgi:hypothetical protein